MTIGVIESVKADDNGDFTFTVERDAIVEAVGALENAGFTFEKGLDNVMATTNG